MKKLSIFRASLKFLLFLFALSALTGSCKKEFKSDKESDPAIMSTPPSGDCGIDYTEDSVGYALCHLSTVGRESVKNFLDYREIVYNYIELQFDREDNVLIKTLIDPENGNLPSSPELENALEAFFDINNDTLYPQIYIPNYADLKEVGIIGSGSPIIVPYAGQNPHEENDGYTGYFVNDDGGLEEYPETIDSAFASTHEIWVISLNESVDNNAEIDIIASNFDEEYPYSSRISTLSKNSSSNRTMATVNCHINKMTVKQHKESWVGGKSEVSIKAYLWTWNGRWNGSSSGALTDYVSDNSTFDEKGKIIKEFKRKDVKDQNEKTLNYNLQRDWKKDNYYTDPICFGYVIFERDKWPTGIKTGYVTLPSNPTFQSHSFVYRSADDYYSVGTIYNMPLIVGYGIAGPWQDNGQSHNLLVDRSSIKFNTQEY